MTEITGQCEPGIGGRGEKNEQLALWTDPRTRTALLGVCFIAVIVFANSLANNFAFDDVKIIQENPNVQGLHTLPAIVTGYVENGMHRPVTFATYALDWELWNGRPFGFHLTNLLLHTAVTGLVFALLLHLGTGVAAAVAGAAIFAVHPVHVEAVANVVGRAELLAAFFFLAACLVYLRAGTGWASSVAIGALYLLSLWSKEMGVTLPGALLLIEAYRGGIRSLGNALRARWRVYLTLAVALAVFFLIRTAVLGGPVGAGDAAWFAGEQQTSQFWTAVRIFPEYLRLMLFPLDLVPDYAPGVIVPEANWRSPLVVMGIMTAAVAVLIVVRTWGHYPLIAVGILWFAGTVLPITGLVVPNAVLLAERTLYIPSIGLSILVGGLLVALRRAGPSTIRWALAVVTMLVLAGGVRSMVHNRVWRDTSTVLTYLTRTHPGSYRSQWSLALHAQAAGREGEALDRFRLALRMVPGHHNLRMDYAEALFQAGDYSAAAAQYDAALSGRPSSDIARLQLANSLIAAGQWQEAEPLTRDLVEEYPNLEVVHHLRARVLVRAGDFAQAHQARTHAARLAGAEIRWAHLVNLAALDLETGAPHRAALRLGTARTLAPVPDSVPTIETIERWLENGDHQRLPLW